MGMKPTRNMMDMMGGRGGGASFDFNNMYGGGGGLPPFGGSPNVWNMGGANSYDSEKRMAAENMNKIASKNQKLLNMLPVHNPNTFPQLSGEFARAGSTRLGKR